MDIYGDDDTRGYWGVWDGWGKGLLPRQQEPRFFAGMSPHLGVSQVPRPLPIGLHKFLDGVAKPDAHYLFWYTPDINGNKPRWGGGVIKKLLKSPALIGE